VQPSGNARSKDRGKAGTTYSERVFSNFSFESLDLRFGLATGLTTLFEGLTESFTNISHDVASGRSPLRIPRTFLTPVSVMLSLYSSTRTPYSAVVGMSY
jgi:hypothetical protein